MFEQRSAQSPKMINNCKRLLNRNLVCVLDKEMYTRLNIAVKIIMKLAPQGPRGGEEENTSTYGHLSNKIPPTQRKSRKLKYCRPLKIAFQMRIASLDFLLFHQFFNPENICFPFLLFFSFYYQFLPPMAAKVRLTESYLPV